MPAIHSIRKFKIFSIEAKIFQNTQNLVISRCSLAENGKENVLNPLQEAFNTSMSGVRESVEWRLRDIVEYFKTIDFKKNFKIQLSSVGKYYIVCAIFRNALTCLNGNHTSTFFDLEPPTLQEYFS